jgi:hypothetical protein
MPKSKNGQKVWPTKTLKNDFLRIRISTHEKDALTAEAAKEALDLSAWARRELLRAASLLPEAK